MKVCVFVTRASVIAVAPVPCEEASVPPVVMLKPVVQLLTRSVSVSELGGWY